MQIVAMGSCIWLLLMGMKVRRSLQAVIRCIRKYLPWRSSRLGLVCIWIGLTFQLPAFLKEICKELSYPTPQSAIMLGILNAQNKAGNTALHWAALNGHLEAVKVLLDEGSDPTITNQKGHDAVYEAELNDKNDVVEWVLKEGGEGLEEGFGGESAEGEADAMDEGESSSMAEESSNIVKKMENMDIQDAAEEK